MNVIGFDDCPFAREHRGDVRVVGVVYAGLRVDGAVVGRVRRDGANATRVLSELVIRSRFAQGLHAIMLQGIALAGFNVVDLHALHAITGVPVIVVTRRAPDRVAVRRALLSRVRGGQAKWALVEKAGPMERARGLFVQHAGLSPRRVEAILSATTVHGALPEPVRVAHLIAGAIATGRSRGRA